MNIREQIIKCSKDNFDSLYEDPCSENVAESILELPDIAEALELLSLKRQGKLFIVDGKEVINWINQEIMNQYISPDDMIYRKWVDKLKEWGA